MKMLEKLATKVRNAKFAVGAMAASAALPVISVVASATDPEPDAGLSTYKDQIVGSFTSTANDIIPIIVGVLGAGLAVFAIFVGIRLAKKMFSTVSK